MPGNQLCNLASCSINQAPNTNHNSCVWLIRSFREKHQKLATNNAQTLHILWLNKREQTQMGGLIGQFLLREREREGRERWEAEEEERGRSWRAPVYCDSWLLQITTKPLEHLRSGCCMARVPLQHDLISCQGLDARARSEYHILTIIPSDGIKNSVWLTKLSS